MDKEIKTKVDELMKNLGTRELSLDEMDKVSGGAGCVNADKIRTEEDLYYYVYIFLANMEKAYGKDMVREYIKNDFKVIPLVDEYDGWGLAGVYNYLGKRLIERDNS